MKIRFSFAAFGLVLGFSLSIFATLVAPADESSPNQLIGQWRGTRNVTGIKLGLDVKEITPDGTVMVVYFWGQDSSYRFRSYQKAGSSRMKGRLISPNQIEIPHSRAKVIFTLQLDGTMLAKYEYYRVEYGPRFDAAILQRVSPER